MQIEKISISKLNPAQYNPRVRLQPGDAEYEKLKRSIQTFGYIDPIIINADGTIIGGHQRYYVLLDLGYDEIDVVKLDLDEKFCDVIIHRWEEFTGEKAIKLT